MRISVHTQRAAAVMAAVMLVSTAALAQGGVTPAAPAPAAAAPAPAATGAAQSTVPDVVFAVNPNPAAEETKIARTAFAGFLATPVGKVADVQTALVDLDSNGVAQVAVRIKSAGTCTGDRCATVILKYDGVAKKWSPVFERHTSRLQIGRTSFPDGGEPFIGILANGYELWAPATVPGEKYVALLQGQGTFIPLDKQASSPSIAAAKLSMTASEQENTNEAASNMATFSPSPGVRMVAVHIKSNGCSPFDGCPTVVMIQQGNALRPVLTSMTFGNLTVLPSSTLGMQNIGIQEKQGYTTYTWTGSSYRASSTTYSSPLTRAP